MMVFDGCPPLVRRWNGQVPSSKSTNVHSTKEQEIDYRADYITGGVCCCRRWILLQPCYHATDHATDQKYKYTYKYKFAKQIQKNKIHFRLIVATMLSRNRPRSQMDESAKQKDAFFFISLCNCVENIYLYSPHNSKDCLIINSFFILCHPSQPITFHKIHTSCLFHFHSAQKA